MQINLNSKQLSLRRLARGLAQQEQRLPISVDATSLSPQAQKTKLITSMIRVSPHDESTEKLTQALSALPQEALERISQYGTKFEVYDKHSADLPLYARHLQKENLAGAYSPTANVVFVDQKNITGRILVHESLHALDASLGQPSSQKPWTVARDIARSKRQAIRPYATHNSSEYFADNLAASLFSRSEMEQLVHDDFTKGVGMAGLSQEQLQQTHSAYHREGQEKADPIASKLCQKFWKVLPRYPSAKPKPALTPQEYRSVLVERHRARKGLS